MCFKCVVCGHALINGEKHKCPNRVLAAIDGAQRKANNEELYLSYEVPRRRYNSRLNDGFLMLSQED